MRALQNIISTTGSTTKDYKKSSFFYSLINYHQNVYKKNIFYVDDPGYDSYSNKF